mgnify:CR=1 FL=1
MRISYSAIETYLSCPQKYKFQEIDRIRVPKSREALVGTLIHDTLKFMFTRDPLFPTLDEVVSYFRSRWPSREVFEAESKQNSLARPWTEQDERIYFEDGVRMLTRFYERNAPWNYTILDLESHFEVAVADPASGEVHILAGKIDRIDKRPDGTYEIIDYKTARRMPSQADVHKNLQLALYSLGVQKRWPHITPENLTLSLHFLKHGEKLSAPATQAATDEVAARLLKTIREIAGRIRSAKNFEPAPGPLCNWCGYKPMCPAWRHLYKKNENADGRNQNEIKGTVKEYFDIKHAVQEQERRLKELQNAIKEYMAEEGVTRVFGDEGVISQKTIQRYQYDLAKIKELLSPLGKWEEILKADETKLKRLLKEMPIEVRQAVEGHRSVLKEYTVLTASAGIKKEERGGAPFL